MLSQPMILIHVGAGAVAILSGVAALAVRKGHRWHRRVGNVFFLSMLLMAGVGAYGASIKPEALSVLQGIFAIYLVTTAQLAVKRQANVIGTIDYVALVAILLTSTAFMVFGIEALNSESGAKDGFPAVAYFVFGSVAVLATALDLRVIILGGVDGANRIARHLWRMGYALFIAIASLFLGQPQVFPEPIRGIEFRVVPVVAVLLVVAFWLGRVLLTKWVDKDRASRPALNGRAKSHNVSGAA